MGDAHETLTRLQGPIDLLFIDADKAGYLDYLNKLLPLVRPGGLILADNMSQPKPSPDFVKAITTNPNLETIFKVLALEGVCRPRLWPNPYRTMKNSAIKILSAIIPNMGISFKFGKLSLGY